MSAFQPLKAPAIPKLVAFGVQRSPSGTIVLKISISESAGELAKLQFDGVVSGRWVELLQLTSNHSPEERFLSDPLLSSNVTLPDRDGAALSKSPADRRVAIVLALPFIADQIMPALL